MEGKGKGGGEGRGGDLLLRREGKGRGKGEYCFLALMGMDAPGSIKSFLHARKHRNAV